MMICQRLRNAYWWLVFYKDAVMCAKYLYTSEARNLNKVVQLSSVKKMIGTYYYQESFTEQELRFIAESMWWLGWVTSLFGFAFMFGFFGYESPEQAFHRDYNPIRSLLYSKHKICCSICLDTFQPDHRTHEVTPCQHYFHAHCLNKWLESHNSCPICRCAAAPKAA